MMRNRCHRHVIDLINTVTLGNCNTPPMIEANMITHRLLNTLQKRQQSQSDALPLRRKREAAATNPALSPNKLGK